jgi:hypothetical protein
LQWVREIAILARKHYSAEPFAMADKGRQSVRKPATKLPHLRKKIRNMVPRDRTQGKKRVS